MSKRNTRIPFSSDDDKFLIHYIAKYNPEQTGRSGNKLYQDLVDNPRRWPWATRHTMHSWRDRYLKNEEYFQKRISYLLNSQAASKKAEGVDAQSKEPPDAKGRKDGIARVDPSVTTRGNRVPQRKEQKPSINQQPVTSLVNEPDPVTHVKGSTNASSDLNSVSITRVEVDMSERKSLSEDAKFGAQEGSSAITRENLSSRNDLTSTTEPTLVVKQEEDDEVADSQEESSEQEEAKGPVGEDDYMHELFGSSVDDNEEQVAPEEPPQTPSSSPSMERIYPDIKSVPDPNVQNKESHIPGSFDPQRPLNPSQEPTPPQSEPSKHPTTSPQVVHPPALVPTVPTRPVKKAAKRKISDEDPFVDSPPSSPTDRPIVPKGRPIVLKEGPYRNSFVPAQRTVKAVWPPERKRKTFELTDKKLSNGLPAAPTERDQSTAPKHLRRPGQRVQQHANAVASSSKVKLPAAAVQLEDPNMIAKTKQPANKRLKTEHHPNTLNRIGDVTHNTPSPSDSGVIVYRNPVVNSTSVPRIDLRESLQNRLHSLSSTSRGASIISSSRASASASHLSSVSHRVRRRESAASTNSHHRRLSVISERDIFLISLLKREMEKLGNEYGFSADIALNTYAETGSLENTRAVLMHMNISMRAAQQGIYEARPDLFKHRTYESDNDDDSIPEGVIPLQSSPGQKQRAKTTRKSDVGKDMASGQTLKRSSARYPRQSLKYKPLSDDERDALSDYSPPSRTRARRYSKLQREGREEEALAVAFGDSPTRWRRDEPSLQKRSKVQEIPGDGVGDREVRPQVSVIRRGMEPSSSLERPSSPTISIDGCEMMELPIPADERPFPLGERRRINGDAEDYDVFNGEEKDDGESFSDKRQLTREIVPDEDAAQLALMEEHKRLSSKVTINNQDEMRAFEQENDTDLLRRWTVDWIRQRATTIREAQERQRQHDRIIAAKED